jgi:hypothetical protein
MTFIYLSSLGYNSSGKGEIEREGCLQGATTLCITINKKQNSA